MIINENLIKVIVIIYNKDQYNPWSSPEKNDMTRTMIMTVIVIAEQQ